MIGKATKVSRGSSEFEPYDLLPPSFRNQMRVAQVTRSWLTINIALTAVLIGVVAATVLRAKRRWLVDQQTASAAIPLLDLRERVLEIQTQNQTLDHWCRLVEAARPDDSALQTLAAISAASQNPTREVLVDSVHLRLPIEFPPSAAETPPWAVPYLMITARQRGNAPVEKWAERLNQYDRLQEVSFAAITENGSFQTLPDRPEVEFAPIQLNGTPVSTRIVP